MKKEETLWYPSQVYEKCILMRTLSSQEDHWDHFGNKMKSNWLLNLNVKCFGVKIRKILTSSIRCCFASNPFLTVLVRETVGRHTMCSENHQEPALSDLLIDLFFIFLFSSWTSFSGLLINVQDTQEANPSCTESALRSHIIYTSSCICYWILALAR